MSNEEVRQHKGNLSLQLYVKQVNNISEHNTEELIAEIKSGQLKINDSIEKLFHKLNDVGIDV